MPVSPSPSASNNGSPGQLSLLEAVYGLAAAVAIVTVIVIMLQVITKSRRARASQNK